MVAPLAIGAGSGIASLLGALLGSGGGQKTIDPELLKRLFGPQAVGKETNELFAILKNSPAFAQMMRQASMRGNRIGGNARAGLARAGLGSSGIGAVANATSRGLGGTLQLQGQGQLFSQALQAAMQNVGQRQSIFAGSQQSANQQPSFQRMIGSSLLNLGAAGFGSLGNSGGGQ